MSKATHANHVQLKLAVTPPPPKTWKTPVYHLDHYTIRPHVRLVTVQLVGMRGHEKRTETISFPLLKGVPETELVRAAVWFSPNKWTVSMGMNVSHFHGHFTHQVDQQLLDALMQQAGTTKKRQSSQMHAPTDASTSPLYQQAHTSFPQSGQTPPVPQEPLQHPPSFYSQPTQMVSGQFPPPLVNEQPHPRQFQAPNTSLQSGQYQPPPFQQGPPRQGIGRWFKSKSKRVQFGIGCGILLAVLALCICSISSIAATNPTTQATPTSTPTQAGVILAATVTTAAPTDTPLPTATATPKPKPTATPTPKPIVRTTPTVAPVRPTPTPKHCAGVNNNPWCYDFNPGNYITVPPSGFCNYFNCIPTFYGSDDPGDGYVIQCADGMYSQSGGESGACSYHGGVSRTLYAH